MKKILIDTCVIIHIVRESATGIKCLQALSEFDDNPSLVVSVVTKAELESFSRQHNWGAAKVQQLTNFLNAAIVIDIMQSDATLLNSYVMIDGYSKRKFPGPGGTLLNDSAKKMGKNDLWIGATAKTLDIPLMTTDGDFDHLNTELLRVIKVA